MTAFQLLNVLAAVAWTVVALKFVKATGRWLGGHARGDDGWRAALFFVAVNTLGYLGRWAAFSSGNHLDGQEWQTALAMRALSVLCALFIIRISRGYRKMDRG